MIHPTLFHQLEVMEREDPQRLRSFLLLFRAEAPPPPLLAALRSKRERLAALDRHFQQLKAGLLQQLTREEGVSVQDLTSSSTAIVTASAARWRELIRKGSLLDTIPTVEVLPEANFHALGQRNSM